MNMNNWNTMVWKREKLKTSTSRASTVTSPNETHTHYYKLPFVGLFSIIAQRRIRRLTQRFCKNLEIKLVLTCDQAEF